jgi:hypothetical protein
VEGGGRRKEEGGRKKEEGRRGKRKEEGVRKKEGGTREDVSTLTIDKYSTGIGIIKTCDELKYR